MQTWDLGGAAAEAASFWRSGVVGREAMGLGSEDLEGEEMEGKIRRASGKEVVGPQKRGGRRRRGMRPWREQERGVGAAAEVIPRRLVDHLADNPSTVDQMV